MKSWEDSSNSKSVSVLKIYQLSRGRDNLETKTLTSSEKTHLVGGNNMNKKYSKNIAMFLAAVLICTLPIKVNAAENENNISQRMEEEIAASTVLDEEDYSVREISANEIPENVVPLQFDTVEEAMAYLEDYEKTAPFEVTFNNCTNESAGNPLARAKETYICTYERKLTSCYTLYATVDVDNVTKKYQILMT